MIARIEKGALDKATTEWLSLRFTKTNRPALLICPKMVSDRQVKVRAPRSLIRWAGSKKQLLTVIRQHVPIEYTRYVEPFAGSACLFFLLEPQRAVLGDINGELISAYTAISRQPERVYRIASTYPKTKKFYYYLRDEMPRSRSLYTNAARFLYLNRYCFNGLYRTNKAGHFNVPMGTDTGDFPPLEQFCAAAQLLKRASLVHGDFEQSLSKVRRGDFVYLDPPYASLSAKDRNEYGNGSFKPRDIPRLMQRLENIHEAGAKFVLSYSTAPDFLSQLKRPATFRVETRRTIASNPFARNRVPEVLLSNQDLFR